MDCVHAFSIISELFFFFFFFLLILFSFIIIIIIENVIEHAHFCVHKRFEKEHGFWIK